MPFNSLYFVIFLLAVLLVYHAALADWSWRKLFLLAASWLFYATWSPRFLLLLIATTAIDYQLARRIYHVRWGAADPAPAAGRRRARWLLVLSLTINLGVLAFFKYGEFLYRTAAALSPLPPVPRLLSIVVPLGISFYTFHSISYVIDTYRGVRPPSGSFTDFALYVAFFPQLVAGPITRWNFFGPQLERERRVEPAGIEAALFLLAVGFLKKVVCADSLGGFVDEVYADPTGTSQVEAWVALYAYAFQIYFDFSGYTDIATGAALLLGFRLPENFRHPYLAESPREFWRRWHISLSTWLRDYLYVPLGGSRRGPARNVMSLMITMLLGGLWHGAAWAFVLWGGYHGVLLAAHRLVSARASGAPPRTPAWLRRAVTFHLVALGWVLFRAGSVATAAAVLRQLWSGQPLPRPFPLGIVALVLLGAATHGLSLRRDLLELWRRVPLALQGAAYGLVIVLVGVFSAESGRFIYFAF